MSSAQPYKSCQSICPSGDGGLLRSTCPWCAERWKREETAHRIRNLRATVDRRRCEGWFSGFSQPNDSRLHICHNKVQFGVPKVVGCSWQG